VIAPGRAREPRFVPWALPLAVGVGGGVALANLAPPLALAVGTAGVVTGCVRRAMGRGWLLLFAVGVLAGGARQWAWLARPDRVAPLLGEVADYRGVSDGKVLRLSAPRGLKVALAPAGLVPAGRVTVRGRVVRAPRRRNPGGFDARGYLARRGVEAQLLVRQVVAAAPVTPVLERFRRGATRGLAPRQAALMEAMTLGVRDDLGTLRTRFAAAGLAHVLALSGLHVGVLVAALGRALAGLRRRRYPLLAVATVAYVALVGPTPSVVRAALMVLAGLAGLAAGHGRIQAWPALALAATASLLVAPAQLADASFQLSYLAVGGMLLFAPPLVRRVLGPDPRRGSRVVRVARGLAAGCLASVAAQLPSLSLVAGSFGRVPLAAPLVNLVAIPLAGVLVPLGFVAAAVGVAVPAAAGLVNHLVGPLASLLLGVAALGARLPHLVWGEVAPLGHACYAVALGGAALAVHGFLRPWRALLVALCAGTLSAAVPPAHAPPEVVFLDVGQGDATLVRLPGRVDVLVDGGGTPFSDRDVGARVVLPALRALGVHALDVVVATHPDLDHVEGLASVLASMPVGTLVMGPPWPDAAIDGRLRTIARERGIPVHRAMRGERWVFGRGTRRAEIDVLHPGARPLPTTNENSVALLLRFGGVPQVLMLGDAPASVERRLAVPHVPVLKVAHHGSRFSTSAALLRATRPSLAVVSVGENRYGHPDPGVLDRLSGLGVRVVSTQRSGALRLSLSPRGPRQIASTVQARPQW
jgi:competence protein ComEC